MRHNMNVGVINMSSEFLCLAKDLRFEHFKDKLKPGNRLELAPEGKSSTFINILHSDPEDTEQDGFYMSNAHAFVFEMFLAYFPDGKIYVHTITRH